jgi:hypothetical protein
MAPLASYACSQGTEARSLHQEVDSFEEGAELPVPASGLWKQAQQGLRSAASTAVNGGLESRRERPARGYGQLQAGLGVASP